MLDRRIRDQLEWLPLPRVDLFSTLLDGRVTTDCVFRKCHIKITRVARKFPVSSRNAKDFGSSSKSARVYVCT